MDSKGGARLCIPVCIYSTFSLNFKEGLDCFKGEG